MKESYGEDLASHIDPESCAVARKGGCEALTGACTGGLLSREILHNRGADAVPVSGRPHPISRSGKRYGDLARSMNPSMYRNKVSSPPSITSRENREILCLPVKDGVTGRIGKSKDASQ